MKNEVLLPNEEQLNRLEFLSLEKRCLRHVIYMHIHNPVLFPGHQRSSVDKSQGS